MITTQNRFCSLHFLPQCVESAPLHLLPMAAHGTIHDNNASLRISGGSSTLFLYIFPSNASETKRMLSLICSWEERRNSPCGLMIRHFPPEEKIAGSSPASDCFFLFCYSSFRFLFAAYCFLCKDEERKERAESHGR